MTAMVGEETNDGTVTRWLKWNIYDPVAERKAEIEKKKKSGLTKPNLRWR